MAGILPSAEYINVIHGFAHSLRPEKSSSVGYTVRATAPTSFQDLCDYLDEQYWLFWGGTTDNQVSSTGTTIYVGPTPSELSFQTTEPHVGLAATSTAIVSNAALLQKRTNFIGKHNRGRMYVPYVLDDSQVSEVGQLTALTITQYTATANAWLAELDSGNAPMYVAHSVPELGAPRLVTNFTVAPVIGTQRRRLR